MPKPRVVDARSDYRGGLNTATSPDMLNPNELVLATNVRLQTEYGAFSKRTGSRRLHENAIGSGATIWGLTQWDAPGGRQIVAIANGNLYHRLESAGEFAAFTEVTAAFSTGGPTVMVPFRSTSSGAALVLYLFSANGNSYSWDGTTLTEISGTSNHPNARLGAAYHTRMFWVDVAFAKHVFWSVVGDATDGTIGEATDGGSAIVDTLTGESINALLTLGSSLVIATEDSLSRFHGYSNEDIRIEQDTEGISADVGPVGALAISRAEKTGILLADTGPYEFIDQPGGVQEIGVKVEPEFEALVRSSLPVAVVQYHAGRREEWYAVRRTGDTGNRSVYVRSRRLQAWYGPFTYPFAIQTLAQYEDANGDEWLIAGCADGFIRHLDTGVLDDVLFDASGGSTYTMTVEEAPIFFADAGPGLLKSLDVMSLQADVPSTSTFSVQVAEDEASFESETVTGDADGAKNRVVPLGDRQADRFRVRYVDSGSGISTVRGRIIYGWNTLRYRND